jgi:hypothetical protein
MSTPLAAKLTIKSHTDYKGFKTYEVTAKGGWHHCVSVYPKVDWDGQNFEGYEVNWSAWGNTSIEQAEEFIKAMKKAVRLAKKGSTKGGK